MEVSSRLQGIGNFGSFFKTLFHIFILCDYCRVQTAVLLTQVDCDDYKAVCSKYGVQGFPTIKWFPKGSLEPKE